MQLLIMEYAQKPELYLFTKKEIRFFKGVGISLLLLILLSPLIFIPPLILGFSLVLFVAPVISGFYGGRQYPKKGFKVGACAGFLWSIIFMIILFWILNNLMKFMDIKFGGAELLLIVAIFTINTLLCGFGGRFARRKIKA